MFDTTCGNDLKVPFLDLMKRLLQLTAVCTFIIYYRDQYKHYWTKKM